MEQAIRVYDWMTIDEQQYDNFESQLSRNRDYYKEHVTEDDLIAALTFFRQGVCRPDYPGKGSIRKKWADKFLRLMLKWAEDQRDLGKISLERIHEFCLDFIQDLIRQGPGYTHYKLATTVLRNRQFEAYYQKIRGEKLKSYITFLRREFKCSETGEERKKYYENVTRYSTDFISRSTFSDEGIKEAQLEFIELYLYWEFSFFARPEEVRELHHSLASNIGSRFGKVLFKDIEDPSVFKHFLKRVEEIICQLSFNTPDCNIILSRLQDFVRPMFKEIKKAYVFHKVYNEVLDFVITICDKKAGSPLHRIVYCVGVLFGDTVDAKGNPILKGNSELFSVMARRLTEFLNNLEDHSLMSVMFMDSAVEYILVKSISQKVPEHQKLIVNLTKACLKIHQHYTARAAYYALRYCENVFKWKGLVEDARELLDILACVKIVGTKDGKPQETAKYYINFSNELASQIKRDNIGPQVVDAIVEFCLKILDRREPMLFEAASNLSYATVFHGKKNKDLIMSVFTELHPFLLDPNYPWRAESWGYSGRAVYTLADHAVTGLDPRVLTAADYRVIGHFLSTAIRGEFYDDDNKETVFYNVYSGAGSSFLRFLDDQEKLQRAILLIGEVVKLLSHDNPQVITTAIHQLSTISSSGPKILAPFFKNILEAYIEIEDSSLLYVLSAVYPYNLKPMEAHFQTIFELIDTTDRHTALMILQTAAKKQPKLFTDENIATFIEEMSQDNTKSIFFMVLDPLSQTIPQKLVPHLQTLMEVQLNIQHAEMYYLAQILKNIVVLTKDEVMAEKVMTFLEKQIKAPEDQMVTYYCLSEMRGIGGVFRHLLEKRKPVIKELSKRAHIQTVKDQCSFILDVLEGRSLESLAQEIKEVKEDVEELDTRVTQTEYGLLLVNVEVKKQRKDLEGVKTKVDKQGKKIDQIGETVDDTKAKVEQLDSKTLSHAPFWSRDVAKLMNPEDILDWRLLSSRLGYSTEDIRGWAQMHDPCMAMLNEWYATRKTSEATMAVLTALQEMDRLDVVVIVENAMKMSKATVTDEEFDYPEPPEVFISYQWGIQNEVRLLKQHLEKAGFTCWMDIGQMGGGDKLFEKIDKGIRGAKLIICCVTEKYAKSPNCNREVNLSVSLGKPIIPLLMEKLKWPPPGSMGPIFSEYLFIRFFTRPGEETGDQRYWSGPKFQELLMQLSYNNVQPDEQKVEKDYKNWWCPVAEVIKIEKKKTTAASQQKQEDVESGKSSPDVFISYQWGKQKQIQLFYKRLTELGFTCWMDIHQMGGGDSLYDKIDKGVRGAKVVISCITTKYALSANCRREVSLADSLKKPIVPLLLEKMTWPPSGPMSMAFTELLYISFAKDESVQERWDGEKFDELMVSLNQHVPDITNLGKEEEEPKPEVTKPKTPPKQTETLPAPTPAPAALNRDPAPAPAPAAQQQPQPPQHQQMSDSHQQHYQQFQEHPQQHYQPATVPSQQHIYNQGQQQPHQHYYHQQQPQQYYQQQPQYYQQHQQPYHGQSQYPASQYQRQPETQKSSSCVVL